MVRPLLKWAGGKRQLLHELVSRIPVRYGTYWEPFLGGAALFFSLSENRERPNFVLSDINPILCGFYETVRDRPTELIDFIGSIEFGNTSCGYYEARARFNRLNVNAHAIEKSGLLLYLNRHCFNGLYRVNSKGEFNVPFGSYITPRMPSGETIIEASRCLEGTAIMCGDFQDVLSGASGGDFVYLDPPYEPISSSSSFTAYSMNGFDRGQQTRLSSFLNELDRKGVKFMLSNSGSTSLEELYSSFNIVPVEARRNINSKGSGRGSVREILVTNY